MAVRVEEEIRRIEVGVGDLVPDEEADPFAAAWGGVARLVAGTRAHVEHARASGALDPTYESERLVRGEIEVDGWRVAILGRVDGIRRPDGALFVEELKTVVLGDGAFRALVPDARPAWVLQLRIYLWLLAEQGELPSGRLVVVNLPGREVRAFDVGFDPSEVRGGVERRVRELVAEWRTESERLAARRALAPGIEIPFDSRRRGQEEMERACSAALDAGECLLVTAPTGLGKTAAALAAALRHALGHDRRVFFVTSRTTEQRIVARTLETIVARHPGVTAVVLRAKAKVCLNEVVVCHPDFCEYARDYAVKVRAASPRERLLARGLALPEHVRDEALRTRACPFELSLDLTEKADVVVGDYNYVFDPGVAIRRHFEDGPSDDLVLVVDEAHNLLDRAREYYSPALESARVRDLLASVEVRPGPVHAALAGWLQRLLALFGRVARAAAEEEPLVDPASGRESRPAPRELEAVRALRADLEPLLLAYASWRRETRSLVPDDPALALAGEFLRFARVLELDGDEFVRLLEPREDGEAAWRIVCLDPSKELRKRLRSFHAVIAMSATLEPAAYYRDLLGFPRGRTSSVALPSPFARENRRVLVVPTVSTTWRERGRYYGRVAETVREVAEAHAGHWIAFLPSFAYLREIAERIDGVRGELIVQEPDMDDDARRAVLERLERPDGTPRLLLAVLGGVFAEGVDLPGEAVVGVVVVSPGLPQLSLERELLRRRLEDEYGAGFEWAYLVPGLARVVQAAGRLVRSETDRGVVVLLDRRFATPAYARLLPRDWYDETPDELVAHDPAAEVARFFGRGGSR